MPALLIYAFLGALVAVLSSLAHGSMRRLSVAGGVTVLIAGLALPLSAGVGLRSSDAVDPTALGLVPSFPAFVLLFAAPVVALIASRKGGRAGAVTSILAGLIVLLVLGAWTLGAPRLGKLVPVPGVVELLSGLAVFALAQVFTLGNKRARLPGLFVGLLLGVVVAGYLLSPDGRTKFPNAAGYYQLAAPTSAAVDRRLIQGYNANLAESNAIRKEAGLDLLPPIKSISDLTEQGLPQAIAEQGYRVLRPAQTQYGAPLIFLMGGLLLGAGLLHFRRPFLQEDGDWLSGGVIAVVTTLLIPSFYATNFNLSQLVKGAPFLSDFLSRSWPPNLAQVNPANPAANLYPLQEVMSQMALTVEIALVGTFVAAIFAVPLSFLAARNLTARSPLMRTLYGVTRTFFNVDRGIDTLILALVFVAAVGLGPFAGVLAMAIHSVADLGKLYSEAIENVDRGPIEALESVGTSGTNVLRWAILPQVLPLFTSYTLYRFEINFRVSIVLGFVGAGGIGFFIQGAMAAGNYNQMIIGVIAIVLVVNLIDFLSSEVRRRLV